MSTADELPVYLYPLLVWWPHTWNQDRREYINGYLDPDSCETIRLCQRDVAGSLPGRPDIAERRRGHEPHHDAAAAGRGGLGAVRRQRVRRGLRVRQGRQQAVLPLLLRAAPTAGYGQGRWRASLRRAYGQRDANYSRAASEFGLREEGSKEGCPAGNRWRRMYGRHQLRAPMQ